VAALGATVALATAFAPAVLPLVLVAAAAIGVGSLLVGAPDGRGRPLLVALPAVGVALLLSAPWAVGTALAGRRAVGIFGLPVSPAAAPGWGEVVRFAVGPTARSPVVWLLIGASALPLLLGSGARLTWAARLWVMACASWTLALAATHGWMGSFAPSETVVLAPAALAVAAGVGLGIASFEHDLAGRSFGWRQVASGLTVVAVVVGLLPVAAGAASGRWGLPTSGVEQPLAFLDRSGTAGSYRVLWLGDPRALPVGGWSVQPGLSYALTGNRLPDATAVWTPAGPGPAATVAGALHQAITGGTVHLGRLLAAAGVRYIVVVDGLAPSRGGLPASVAAPAPSGLPRALLDQNDLQVVPGEFGVQVFENSEDIPVVAQRATPTLDPSRAWSYPGAGDTVGWKPVLGPPVPATARGVVSPGTLYVGEAPAGRFTLTVNGHAVARRPAFGWAAQYATPAGPATLDVDALPLVPLGVALEVLAWLVLAFALAGGRRWPRRGARRRPEEAA
jgi:hypothetical protein